MNFFESQDTAKRNTRKLISLFALAVLSLIIVTNVLVIAIFGFAETSTTGTTGMAAAADFQFDITTFLLIGALVSAVVLLGSLYKISALSGGGARIAEMMNGRLLVSGTQDSAERRVLNVVEEMAIASGTPVPPVYLMDEPGINAFAAGYTPSDAIIAVTRGTIDTLSRDQLQGVVAHEFSHILHGDMRVNIRLIGVLHGIMILGIIGYYLLHSGRYSRRSKDSGGIVFLGLGLVVVGFVGTFFGNLIKAAVSRQREYLADASAVQFTRNPDGIGQALMQIAKHQEHSYLQNPKSVEISHALFEEGQVSALSRLYATHPPLEDRIRAVLPNWEGDYQVSNWDKSVAPQEEVQAQKTDKNNSDKAATVLTGVLLADALLSQAGSPNSKHLEHADALLHQIPQAQLDAAREPSGARAIVYFLVLSNSDSVRAAQLEYLHESADDGVYQELLNLTKAGRSVADEQRLALTTIASSSLRQLSQQQYQLFKGNFKKLIEIDKKINLLEWALQKIVFHHLDKVFDKGGSSHFGKKSLKSCQQSTAVLLSILTHSTSQEGISAEEAFSAGANNLGSKVVMIDVSEIDFEQLNEALDELTALKPLQKPALLQACANCITADGKLLPIEVELLRAIAATIDCPVPPLLLS